MFSYDEKSAYDRIQPMLADEETGVSTTTDEVARMALKVAREYDVRINDILSALYVYESKVEALSDLLRSARYDEQQYAENSESDYRKMRVRESRRKVQAIIRAEYNDLFRFMDDLGVEQEDDEF